MELICSIYVRRLVIFFKNHIKAIYLCFRHPTNYLANRIQLSNVLDYIIGAVYFDLQLFKRFGYRFIKRILYTCCCTCTEDWGHGQLKYKKTFFLSFENLFHGVLLRVKKSVTMVCVQSCTAQYVLQQCDLFQLKRILFCLDVMFSGHRYIYK